MNCSDSMAAINRTFSRFFLFHILLTCFINLVMVVFPLFVLIQYMFPVQRLFVSMHCFPSSNFEIFTATNISNWVASHTRH